MTRINSIRIYHHVLVSYWLRNNYPEIMVLIDFQLPKLSGKKSKFKNQRR